jgi:DNA-binding MarR family transcriptional regulator
MENNTNDLRAVSIFINAMSNHKLSKADILLLNYLMMKYAGFEQGKSFVINQSKIAENFALKQPNVSRSLKKLVASGLLKSEGLNTFSIDMK